MAIHSSSDALVYQSGFGNQFSSEALSGALPAGQNSPQKHPLGLYAEQFSGTAFTVVRSEARRTWLYRIKPSAAHPRYQRMDRQIAGQEQGPINPNRLRWNAFDIPAAPTDFIDGLIPLASTSAAEQVEGVSVYLYTANTSMQRAFFSADGEWLVVPQQGRLRIITELGLLDIEPLEIAVLPRGLKFCVQLLDSSARGYLCENHGCALRLPELGPIGSNGLANSRDFLTPVAWFEDSRQPIQLVQKFLGELWSTQLEHSPFDVVGWHGNNVPYKYDLRRFNTLGTVSYDHPDPSIFTVLTSPGAIHGQANIDFVIFPPRWMVAENTFRPPWFHRNLMNEFMGLIDGAYDAKAEGFMPGGASLHNCMSAHGPDNVTAEKAIAAELKPHRIDNTMAFMFETGKVLRPSRHALDCPQLQTDYDACWKDMARTFTQEPR
ncbi:MULTISPECIES: homogentisate 1,2-dioxygenase [Pseudomonas]|uniref:Homogentisate 1,2-dioxygenase n=1 Tax=Pseudomonas coronafaciens pv. striafaciens TaxID=235276 RepID=A0A3M4Y4T5_9PSED|nr:MULTISPECIES: homogentisate 1,2-dioxygenase [Pseudomonas]MBP1084869.1 homogentisate 1,2-dioxygenase [Pseudomonas sp. PvP007]MBP1194093.1 homogentisate 1,2-dioxygenase [Pseudomonas sp. PvP100]MBS7419954.1 homogentisate 1,2-dioxygenase [Pseudomonas syringae]NAO55220.1 homogentisate 1,2-dioxygenase [Pseudomonas syringae]RMR83013.1 Homogentisate 1,2-dioxygenase [Pseudomonas coronafaciens pv. striafaciens]